MLSDNQLMEIFKLPLRLSVRSVQLKSVPKEEAASSPTSTQANKSKNLGGIDMNQKALDLQTSGEEIKFDMPFDPAQLPNIQIDGFSPVILQILPTNLPLFIGAQEKENKMQVSRLN